MADYAEFFGPSYTRPVANIQIQSERTVNWRLERMPGKAKSRFALLRQPGLSVFSNTALASRVRGMYALNGHLYAIVGNHVLEIFADGSFTDYSVSSGIYVLDDGRKAWIAGNPTQLMIVSGGNGYILAGTLRQIGSADFPNGSAAACTFLDGYFIVTLMGSQQFQISALNDGLTWDASDISSVESRPDFIVAPIELREEIWFFGSATIQPFYNNGDPYFPLVPNQAAIINAGLMAAESVVRIGNTLFWLEVDENGHGVFCRNEGYNKIPISNPAIESVWNLYNELSSAYAWAYQENGHPCVRLNFQNTGQGSGSASWEYDLSVDQWTEVPYWNSTLGVEEAHRGYCSAVAFDKILVGDRSNGKIYELKSTYLDDAGDVIRRVRRAPHLYSEKHRIEYNRLEFDGNMGIGLGDSSNGDTYNPKGILYISNNGGRTFNQKTRDIHFGTQSSFNTRAFAAGLGSARDRVYEFVVTAPVDWGLAAARLDYRVMDN